MGKMCIYFRYLLHRNLLSWRMLSVVVVTILTMDTFLAPIRSYCRSAGLTVSQWGYALIWNNKYVGLCFLLIYIFAVSVFPEERKKERYAIARIGISCWVGAQALFLIFFGWLYAFFLYLIQNLLLIGVIEWTGDWGNGWKCLLNSDTIEKYDILVTMPRKVLSNGLPFQENIMVLIIMGMLLGMIGMLVMWLNFYGKSLGSLAATAVIFMSLAAQRYPLLYRYSPASWIQLEYHYSITNIERPKPEYIMGMLLLLTALFYVLTKVRANNTQENNRREM